MQTSTLSTMAMMNRNTQFKSLCQFPSKLFSWSINSSATRCSSNCYPITTAAPRIAPVNSTPRSNIHGGFSFPSSFLQMSLGPGNLKFNVSRCNSILLQNLCFSTTQYELACKSVVDDEFGKKNAADFEEKILGAKGGGDKSLTFFNTLRYKTTAGYKCVVKLGLSEARIKYYCSTGGNNDSKEDNQVWTHWDSDNPPTTPTPAIEPDYTPVPSPFAPAPPGNEYNPARANENEPAHAPPDNENEPAHAPPNNENEPVHAPPDNENEPVHAPAANENEPAHAPPANENDPAHALAANENGPAHVPPANENGPAHVPPAYESEPDEDYFD